MWTNICFIGLTCLALFHTHTPLASSLTCDVNSRAYIRLMKRINKIQLQCGEICNTNLSSSISEENGIYEQIRKDVNCPSLFGMKEGVSEFNVPIEEIPESLKPLYSYNGRIPISSNYMKNDDSGVFEASWRKEIVDFLQQTYRNGTLTGPYGEKYVSSISDALKSHGNVENARVLVVGSQSPWIEAMLLELGAVEVITLEYSEIQTDHSSIHPVLPEKFNEDFLSGVLEPFDLTVSFSSLEHSGLGRYGDPLNPWGDLITMAKVWCATRTGGRAIIGVPTGVQDEIIFNAAKIYGPIQYGHLFANWKPVFSNSDPSAHYDPNCKWCYQPLFVLEK